MAEGANRVPLAKSWADEIDDLYHDATERRLRAVLFTRPRDPVANAEITDERLRGARSVERGPSASFLAQ